MKYEFIIALIGEGDSPEEAWEDTIDVFCCDPGWYDRYIELPEEEDD